MGIGRKNQLVADGALMQPSIIPSILSCIPPGPPVTSFSRQRGEKPAAHAASPAAPSLRLASCKEPLYCQTAWLGRFLFPFWLCQGHD